MSALRKFHIPLPGAILVLLAFFLPWMSVSCLGVQVAEGSGYSLATGKLFSEMGALLGGGEMPVDPGMFRVLWLVPAAAVLSLALFLVTMRRPDSERRTSLGHIGAGLLGFAGPAYMWLQTRGSSDVDMSAMIGQMVELKYGLWLAIIGLLIIIVGGVLSYMEARRGGGSEHYDPYPMTQTTPAGGYTPLGGGALPDAPPPPASSYSSAAGATAAPFSPPTPAAPPRRATEVLSRADTTAMAWLVIKEGPRAGHSFRLMETTSIGRDAGNDIILDDSSLSGQHAKVKLENGSQFIITDLASTNGMFLFDREKNDWERVYRVELTDGAQLKLGRTVLFFMTPTGKETADKTAKDQAEKSQANEDQAA
ncbi:MAG: FHA domain-containing protein [Anaerolineae bacterium]|nr:FHA domain-containing protein [Anaerolineae bacterium]RIK23331.1 MAG: hypothetical protein DCC51_03890 [Anaerolineae bacterium]